MLAHEKCKKKKEEGPKKSKSSSALGEAETGESTDEMSDDSEEEDSCSSSANDKQSCACCYCEVFGHGNPSGAPVPSNYPQVREKHLNSLNIHFILSLRNLILKFRKF